MKTSARCSPEVPPQTDRMALEHQDELGSMRGPLVQRVIHRKYRAFARVGPQQTL